MSEVFEGYVTKYALTAGILKRPLETSWETSGGTVMAKDRSDPLGAFYHGEGREWHRTWEGAVARAEEMRKAKLASLRKSIAKLERMTWEPPA